MNTTLSIRDIRESASQAVTPVEIHSVIGYLANSPIRTHAGYASGLQAILNRLRSLEAGAFDKSVAHAGELGYTVSLDDDVA